MRPQIHVIEEPELIWFYVSSIGGCIGVIIITSILIHILSHYYHILKSKSLKAKHKNLSINKQKRNNKNSKKTKFKQFHHEAVNKKKRQRIISILTILYLFTSLITVLMYLFVRNNLITRINISSFNITQCSFGYFVVSFIIFL